MREPRAVARLALFEHLDQLGLHKVVEGRLAPPVVAHGREHRRAVARLEALVRVRFRVRVRLRTRVRVRFRGGKS